MTTNTVRVVVYPSGADEDDLTVADAMQQVLDYFTLLSKADAASEDEVKVVWKLKYAGTNSPFTVEATAASSNPAVPLANRAARAKSTLCNAMLGVLSAQEKASWIDTDTEATLRRMLSRNLNGIRRTDFVIDDISAPTIIDIRSAISAQAFLDLKAAEEAAKVEDLSRKEYGSLEGYITGLTTYHRKPAVRIRERLSELEVKCVLSPLCASTIGDAHNWKEVWSQTRIFVSGTCHYDKYGKLILVDADDMNPVISRDVPIGDVRDTNFSAGLTPQEHLKRLWGDDHG